MGEELQEQKWLNDSHMKAQSSIGDSLQNWETWNTLYSLYAVQ